MGPLLASTASIHCSTIHDSNKAFFSSFGLTFTTTKKLPQRPRRAQITACCELPNVSCFLHTFVSLQARRSNVVFPSSSTGRRALTFFTLFMRSWQPKTDTSNNTLHLLIPSTTTMKLSTAIVSLSLLCGVSAEYFNEIKVRTAGSVRRVRIQNSSVVCRVLLIISVTCCHLFSVVSRRLASISIHHLLRHSHKHRSFDRWSRYPVFVTIHRSHFHEFFPSVIRVRQKTDCCVRRRRRIPQQ
jgi:hypothetical protein